jgi:hypothetical protein
MQSRIEVKQDEKLSLKSIPYQLEQLAVDANQLASTVELLEIKLDPALQPIGPAGVLAESRPQATCKLAEEVATIRDTIGHCYGILLNVLDRLEI